MKKILITPLLFILFLLYSCDGFLDIVPDNVATIEHAFSNRTSAEKFLFTCYSYLPSQGKPAVDPAILGSDEIWIHDLDQTYSASLGAFNTYNTKRGLQNVSTPLCNFWDGGNSGSNLFIGLRDCNIFLDNIQSVLDVSPAERNRWAAEVTFLKAYLHYYLLRMYGPIPLIRENLPISASINEVQVYRDPVDECVNYIVELLDEAAEVLPLEVYIPIEEMGRITKPIARALKAEVLLLAASPLFNGNPAYADLVDSRGVHLFPTEYSVEKWKIAMDACLDAIETADSANHQIYYFNDLRYPVSDETKALMSNRNVYGEKWNREIIWGIPENTISLSQGFTLPPFTEEHLTNAVGQPVFSAPLHVAEMFYSKNGVPIDEDPSYNYENRYETSQSTGQKYYVSENFVTANLNQNREPRFYASLAFDGAVWFGNGRYKDVGKGDPNADESWVIRGKAGELAGKNSSIRYNITGYYIRKYSSFETSGTTTMIYKRMTYPVFRLADLYLMYAEARNEYVGPDADVYKYLDLVRERAGLKGVVESWADHSRFPDKPTNQSGLREIIRKERMIELAFEGKRFWDLRRWNIADEVLNRPIRAWNVNGKNTAEYYNTITLELMEFSTKEYFWPLRQHALRSNPNLVQNPYW